MSNKRCKDVVVNYTFNELKAGLNKISPNLDKIMSLSEARPKTNSSRIHVISGDCILEI